MMSDKIKFMSLLYKLIILFSPLIFWPGQAWGGDDEYGVEAARKAAELPDKVAGAGNIPALIGKVVGVGLSMVGIIFFLLILYSGFRWMTAMGQAEVVQKSKDTILAAAIGLVLVLSAYAITNFVFTGLGAV